VRTEVPQNTPKDVNKEGESQMNDAGEAKSGETSTE
jgi:hypothetical protein